MEQLPFQLLEDPQLPSNASPSDEPIRPAKILAIQPMDLPLPVIAPAIKPITPPTINTHSQCNILGHLSPYLVNLF